MNTGSNSTAADAPDARLAGSQSASRPWEIAPPRWKDILSRCYRRLTEDRLIAIAAGVTFYVLLAIFPAIAALVSIYGVFADPGTIARHLDEVSSFVPGGAIEVIRDQLNRVTSQDSTRLGLGFLIGLGVSLWSANAGMKAMMDALNVAYSEREKRGFFRLNAVSLTFTLGAIMAAIVGIGTMVILPLAVQFLQLDRSGRWLTIGVWPMLVVAVALAVAILYRYGPSRKRTKRRWISWGSVLATAGWIAISVLFSWYASHFGNYNKTYGSLGAVIGFMTWIWLSVTVILLGAEFDAAMDRQTECETSAGVPKLAGGS